MENRDIASLDKEGCREAAGESGANASPIGRSNREKFDQEINYLTNTTPALRATPPQLRRGVFRTRQLLHIFIDRAYRGTRKFPILELS